MHGDLHLLGVMDCEETKVVHPSVEKRTWGQKSYHLIQNAFRNWRRQILVQVQS